MVLKKKIHAGALQLVLSIGAIIAVLLLSFVLLIHSHKLFKKKTDVSIKVIRQTDRALESSFDQELPIGQEMVFSGRENLGIHSVVQKRYWGLLEIMQVTAKKGKFSFAKIAFVGSRKKDLAALYLRDQKRPLVLAGNTRITGTSYLPERGVKIGNIYGDSYYATELIYGKEKTSGDVLPRFSTQMTERLDGGGWKSLLSHGNIIRYKTGLILKQSFKKATKVIKGDYIRLEKSHLVGNLIIWASKKITVEASTQLKDVLLIAPEIEIRNWTKGNFQALASKSIKVGKGCELNYPSVLLVTRNMEPARAKNDSSAQIELDAYAELRGFIIYRGLEGDNRYMPNIKIDQHAKVIGEVYCDNNLELKGSVIGNVTTGGFVALENGNIYQNHIYNGLINSKMLPSEYAGISYVNEPSNQIMKWLY